MPRRTRFLAHCVLAATCAGWLTATCVAVEVEPEPVEVPAHALSLTEAVELALRNNPDVRIGRQRVLQAAALVDESASRFWPEVSAYASFARTDRPSRAFSSLLDQGEFTPAIDFNDPGAVSDFRLGGSARFTLYDGGRRKARLVRSEAHLGAAAAAEEEVRSIVAYEVARAWYGAHQARTAARVSERRVEVLTRLHELSRAELEAGAALPLEVQELSVRLTGAEAQARTAVDVVRRAETGLGLLLGLGVQERVELAQDAPELTSSIEPLEGLLARAHGARPELVRAQLELEAALATLRETEAGYWPEFGLFADVGTNSPDLRIERFNWLFAADLVQSVTAALRTPHRVRGATAGLMAAHERARSTLLEVELEVESAWLDAGPRSATAGLMAAHERARSTLLEVELEVESAWLDAGAAERDLALASEDETLATEALRRAQAEREAGAGRQASFLQVELAADEARARTRIAELRRDLSRIALAHATGEFPAFSEGDA